MDAIKKEINLSLSLGKALTILGILGAVVSFVISTFATIPYVDAKHEQAVSKIDHVLSKQTSMEEVIKRIDGRVYDLHEGRSSAVEGE